jgi:hypothetical protein
MLHVIGRFGAGLLSVYREHGCEHEDGNVRWELHDFSSGENITFPDGFGIIPES